MPNEPKYQVIRARPDQQPVLANLLELYAHDFSEFHDLELGPDGRFGYKHLSLYWSDPNRHPFLIRVDGQLAGLILVKGLATSRDTPMWDMAEFFVVRGYRRHGVGTETAHDVWRRFPGQWEVRVMQSNRHAHEFWKRAISAFTGAAAQSVILEKDGARWHVFSFLSIPS